MHAECIVFSFCSSTSKRARQGEFGRSLPRTNPIGWPAFAVEFVLKCCKFVTAFSEVRRYSPCIKTRKIQPCRYTNLEVNNEAAVTSSVGLVALGFAVPASAADLGVRRGPAVAPVAVAPIYNWTGFYIGGHAGWGQAERPPAMTFSEFVQYELGRVPRRWPGRLQLSGRPIRVRRRRSVQLDRPRERL